MWNKRFAKLEGEPTSQPVQFQCSGHGCTSWRFIKQRRPAKSHNWQLAHSNFWSWQILHSYKSVRLYFCLHLIRLALFALTLVAGLMYSMQQWKCSSRESLLLSGGIDSKRFLGNSHCLIFWGFEFVRQIYRLTFFKLPPIIQSQQI